MIGIFDSGVGGLSVLTEIRELLPDADLLYVADRGRAPYGPRSLEEVRAFSFEVAEWLLAEGAMSLVVACNTASAAALDELRLEYPSVPIVGMEPAVKPAATSSDTGVVAVFATAATFQGRLFESVVDRHAGAARLINKACPEWVALVEEGHVGGDAVATVSDTVEEVITEGADRLVLGCTHFSFLRPVIEKTANGRAIVIDPAPAVAAQTVRVSPSPGQGGQTTLTASGDLPEFLALAEKLAGLTPKQTRVFP